MKNLIQINFTTHYKIITAIKNLRIIYFQQNFMIIIYKKGTNYCYCKIYYFEVNSKKPHFQDFLLFSSNE